MNRCLMNGMSGPSKVINIKRVNAIGVGFLLTKAVAAALVHYSILPKNTDGLLHKITK